MKSEPKPFFRTDSVMSVHTQAAAMPYTYEERLAALRAAKVAQTQDKQNVVGAMDYDDWALILPPPDRRELVQTISGSGVPINDVKLTGVDIQSNHAGGGFFGPEMCGRNFRALLEVHPPYVDPNSSMAGGYMANFLSYRTAGWKPELALPEELQALGRKYQLSPGVGATQHFCQDLSIGLELGWGGLLARIEYYRQVNPAAGELYAGLEHVVRGMQVWIRTNVREAQRLADPATPPECRQNLTEMAAINDHLITEPPRTFREACQWILWYDMAARMYNGSGSLGRLDVLLQPFYAAETEAGLLEDEEVIFHVACMLIRDTAYFQLGGPDREGRDVTSRLSYLILEACRRLRVPVNAGVCVGPSTDPGLLRKGVEIMLENRQGVPKFLGIDQTSSGFTRNGIPVEVARTRAYSGCHWSAIPGREYTMNDCVKLNFGPVFDVALRELLADDAAPAMDDLWSRFEHHLAVAVDAEKRHLDFHLRHMHEVFPELVLDLLCYGPVQKGVDASDGFRGGVEHYNLCIDGCALATVADSLAALEQRVVQEQRLSWEELLGWLDADWAGREGERMRVMMHSIDRYGSGGSRADEYARRISQRFTQLVAGTPTPAGFNCIPGLFSWANTIGFGRNLGATPNGRHGGAPISHGANPEPGFRKDGAPSAMAVAIASVQPGYGNTAPMQIELDPGSGQDGADADHIAELIRTHFELGGTQINLNIMDREQVLAAHDDPALFPDLVVRVTGFSAYFASLSPEFRQLVVDRIIAEN